MTKEEFQILKGRFNDAWQDGGELMPSEILNALLAAPNLNMLLLSDPDFAREVLNKSVGAASIEELHSLLGVQYVKELLSKACLMKSLPRTNPSDYDYTQLRLLLVMAAKTGEVERLNELLLVQDLKSILFNNDADFATDLFNSPFTSMISGTAFKTLLAVSEIQDLLSKDAVFAGSALSHAISSREKKDAFFASQGVKKLLSKDVAFAERVLTVAIKDQFEGQYEDQSKEWVKQFLAISELQDLLSNNADFAGKVLSKAINNGTVETFNALLEIQGIKDLFSSDAAFAKRVLSQTALLFSEKKINALLKVKELNDLLSKNADFAEEVLSYAMRHGPSSVEMFSALLETQGLKDLLSKNADFAKRVFDVATRYGLVEDLNAFFAIKGVQNILSAKMLTDNNNANLEVFTTVLFQDVRDKVEIDKRLKIPLLTSSEDLYTQIPSLKILRDIIIKALGTGKQLPELCKQILDNQLMPVNFLIDALPPESVLELIVQLRTHEPDKGFEQIDNLIHHVSFNEGVFNLVQKDTKLCSSILKSLEWLVNKLKEKSSDDYEDDINLINSAIESFKGSLNKFLPPRPWPAERPAATREERTGAQLYEETRRNLKPTRLKPG